MRPQALVIVLLLLVCAPALRAQREANVWYFGRGAGIDFNGGVPRALTGSALDQKEGSASIADPATGAPLFYTDGITVWNREHRPMPNGRGLMGHADATQSALIVPAPCQPDRFYVFTADASPLMDPPNDGVHYSLVDMELDGGRGDVVTKNVPLYSPATEKLTAVRHANGVDYWVITHEWGSNLYRTFHVSADGVAPSAVLSYVGSAHDGSAAYGIGYLKASPDGRMLASVVTTSFTELLDFNASNGLISNARRISERSKYGASFSPDNRLLYLVERGIGWGYDSLFQYDLTAGSTQGVIASRVAVGAGDFWALQNAPDGRIYIANNSHYLPIHRGWLATIDRPNERGAACGFNLQGFRFEVGGVEPVVTEGLPNMIESFAQGLVRPCGPPDAFIGVDDPICAGACVPFRDSSGNLPTAWEWSFEGGRPATSREQHPGAVCFDSAGVYTVMLVASNAAGSDTTVRTVTVQGASSVRAEAGVATVAPGDTATIPITIGALEVGTPVDALEIRLGYDRTTMTPVGLDIGGALLAGWTLLLEDDTATATVRIRATAPAGRTLPGAGRLVAVRFATWLATSSTAQLPLELEVPGLVCTTVPGRSGGLTLEICGIQQRIIELDTTLLLLRPVHPNPASGAVTVAFTTPGDGPVRLTVHDASGRAVATLVDGVLPAGEHAITWSPEVAGLYLCRLAAGGQVAVRSVVVGE